MKIPEKAPAPPQNNEWMKLWESGESYALIQKTKADYLHWEEFKYLPFPHDVKPQDAWAFVKVLRGVDQRALSVRDNQGDYFRYCIQSNVYQELHYIDQNAGGIMLVEDPNIHQTEKERYIINSLMEEAIASSQLEGAATERRRAKELLRSGRKPQDASEQMIVNNYLTIKEIKDHLEEPLSFDLLKRIQASLTKDTPLPVPDGAGRFRKDGEEYDVVDQRDGTLLHTPCPAHEIEARMEELCNYANEEKGEFTHPVIKAVILHFLLAYIHPFVDGNGRTSRALFYWYLLKKKYWMFEYLTISKIILKTKEQYAKAFLYTETDNSDVTYFINFHLRAIKLAIIGLKNYLTAKQKENKESTKLVRVYPGISYMQQQIVHHALTRPYTAFSVEYYKNFLGVVYETARSSLHDLVRKGLLTSFKQGRTFHFQVSQDIVEKLKKQKP